LETLDPPAVATGAPRVPQPIMQTVVAVLPELDVVRDDAVATPSRRPRDVAVTEARLELDNACLQLVA
jgi:hypothetical protein